VGINPPALIWLTIQGIIDIILYKHSSSCGYLANFLIELVTNQIVGTDQQKILAAYHNATSGNWRQSQAPPLWDEKAAKRIVDIIVKTIKKEQSHPPQRVLPGAL
jgi:hypothetical protein